MTDEQILVKAIKKAYPEKQFQDEEDLLDYAKGQIERDEGYRLIFSHYFAKAFWHYKEYYRSKDDKKCWQYHLQQMVLKEEPLKYIERFLEEK